MTLTPLLSPLTTPCDWVCSYKQQAADFCGLSTDEPWPASLATLNRSTRVYLFAPRPWRPAELNAIATTPISSLAREIAR